MILPDPRLVDPFGLWEARLTPRQAPLPGDGLSFTLPDGESGAYEAGAYEAGAYEAGAYEAGADEAGAGEDITPAWTLDLTSGPGARTAARNALALRRRQVQTIQDGLAQAEARVEALLNQRQAARASGGEALQSFGLAAGALLPPPEAELSALLDCLEYPPTASFGPEAVTTTIPWEALRQQLQRLMDSVNRQVLHFAWVDTRLDRRLVARTSVDWGGDVLSAWDPGLSPDQLAAHRRSLELALASRAANLRAILTVSQIAAKLALALTTPLGPAQALALGWQFVQSVIMPALAAAQADSAGTT